MHQFGAQRLELLIALKASPRFRGNVDDPVDVRLDIEKLHPFDAGTGDRRGRAVEPENGYGNAAHDRRAQLEDCP